MVKKTLYIHITCGGRHSVMAIVKANGMSGPSSNPGQDCLPQTSHSCL